MKSDEIIRIQTSINEKADKVSALLDVIQCSDNFCVNIESLKISASIAYDLFDDIMREVNIKLEVLADD